METNNHKGHSRNQYLTIFCVNLVAVAYGSGCAWISPSIPILQSVDSPLPSGPITAEEGSWISSIMCLGGVLGTLVCGWIAERYGRKLSLFIVAFPQICAMFLIIYAMDVSYLIASRFLSGFAAGGLFVVIPLYAVEIAEDRNRGALGAIFLLFSSIGFLLGFILGYYLNYAMLPWALVILPFIFLCGFTFVPESPAYLMKKQKINEAEKALRFFRGFREKDHVSPEFTAELLKLKNSFSNEKKLDAPKLEFKDFKTKAAKKSLILAFCIIFFHEFCGVFAMVNYSATIFIEAGSTLSPDLSSIIIGLIQVFGAYTSTVLVDKAGRKLLFGLSALGLCIGLGSMGIFAYYKKLNYDVSDLNWIPLFCFSFTIFVGNIGVLNLPYLIIAEILPVKIKDFAMTSIMIVSWTFSFLSVRTLSPLMLQFGMHGTLGIFSLVCFIGVIFVILFVPETKGRSFEAIMEMLEK